MVMLWISWGALYLDWMEGSVWCVIVNSVIHTIMYSYYLLTALGYDVWWKKYLTATQIFQFCTGTIYVSIYLYNHYMRGQNGNGGCGTFARYYMGWAAHIVNLSFILLFLQFFMSTYTNRKTNGRTNHKTNGITNHKTSKQE